MRNLFNQLFRRGPCELLIKMVSNGNGNFYMAKIAKEADLTHSHAVKILKEFMDLGLIESEKNGRRRYIKLTEEGNEVAMALYKIRRISEGIEVRNL